MRKILIVEDEGLLRDAYQTILSTEPYDVDVAQNGQEALDKCKEKIYDLILLDLMMPVMDGVEFLKHFNDTDTRIIVLSNLTSGEMLEQSLELGAESNLVKATLSPRELLSKVRYVVSSIV